MIYPEIVIVGCGNPLFGDDGFGPAVIEELKKYSLPSFVKAVDGGTGALHYIFPFLDPRVTKTLIIVDLLDFGQIGGFVTRVRFDDLPEGVIFNAVPGGIAESLFLMQKDFEIIILGCQPQQVSYPEFMLELSIQVQKAIPEAVDLLMDLIHERDDILACIQKKQNMYAMIRSHYDFSTSLCEHYYSFS
jgi:coenzyme F420 hydrogenase subunit delta